ncbi:hypothetical protein NRB_34080 [Novosphingobium sp. 11B]
MRLRNAVAAGATLLSICGWVSPAIAGPKAIQRYKAVVEGEAFKVIRYENGTVKIVDGGMFGPNYSFKQRDRMRRAAKQATGCDVDDDFDQDGKLIGKLVCGTASAS